LRGRTEARGFTPASKPTALTLFAGASNLKGMEVQFTPEQEAQLSQLANQSGTDAERLVRDAALRLLGENARFHEAVAWGLAAAERGELVDHEEVWATVEKILQS
jgi:predicted transcriptional regulator